ncbi:hypothetical protein C0J52_19614 [Blattella germanica]|nr:hypothetical protein C0J52_19614 [Blattella germanica]
MQHTSTYIKLNANYTALNPAYEKSRRYTYRATLLQIQTRRYQPPTFLKKRVLLLQ